MEVKVLKNILEGAMLAAGKPLTLDNFLSLFEDKEKPERDDIKQALKELDKDLSDRGVELKRVASGYRLQVKNAYSPWVSRLWEEKPPRYSRAFLETLALVAYRQPISRGEIEAVRGVAVSTSIIRTMLEREWIKVVGHRDVPGKPALYGTTKQFLDSFNLKSLEELPSLMEVRNLNEISKDMGIELPAEAESETAQQEIDLSDEAAASGATDTVANDKDLTDEDSTQESNTEIVAEDAGADDEDEPAQTAVASEQVADAEHPAQHNSGQVTSIAEATDADADPDTSSDKLSDETTMPVTNRPALENS